MKKSFLQKHFYLFLTLVFILTKVNAQQEYNSTEFRVSESDLQNTIYSKDSTANALVIYEYGKSFISEEDYDVITEYKVKIKILNQRGFHKGKVEFYLYKNKLEFQEITDIEATTYNKVNGEVEITKLEKEHIYKQSNYRENYDLVSLALPNIKEGSVITYSYRFKNPFIFNYKSWNFQEDIPKLYSEYNTNIPGNFHYNIKLVGTQPLDVNTSEIKKRCVRWGTASADCAESVYVMKNIPAFVEENYLTSKKNFLSKIEYELLKTQWFNGETKIYTKEWKDVDYELKKNEEIGKELKRRNISEKLKIPLLVSETNDYNKAVEIYNYVQNNFTWNEKFKLFSDLSLKDLMKESVGNTSEINVLLHNLLRENNLDAHIVLLSTRENGLPTKLFPVISEFNYAIVQVVVEGKPYLLDATDKFLVFGEIPFRCLNEYGRLIDFENGSSWLPIVDESDTKTQYYINAKLNAEGKLEGILNNRTSGYHAFNKKKSYYGKQETYLENLQKTVGDLSIKNHTILTQGTLEENVVERFSIENTKKINKGERYYFDPFLVKFFTVNPFKLTERTYPIDFGYKDNYVYSFNLDIDEQYEVVELPKSIRMKLPEEKGEFSFIAKQEGTKIQFYFSLKFNESKYEPHFYESLKQLMAKVVDVKKNRYMYLL